MKTKHHVFPPHSFPQRRFSTTFTLEKPSNVSVSNETRTQFVAISESHAVIRLDVIVTIASKCFIEGDGKREWSDFTFAESHKCVRIFSFSRRFLVISITIESIAPVFPTSPQWLHSFSWLQLGMNTMGLC